MNFISIGGWCGTKVALTKLGLFDEPSLPFDSVRTSIEGIIDCIENNFENFFPKEIKKDNRFSKWAGFVGEYVGFYNKKHNLLNKDIIESFKRQIIRFDEKIRKNNCVFLRIISREKYDDEIKYYKKLQDVIDRKYPGISYIICFIIPNQNNTQYYKNLDEKTFLFTLNDKDKTVFDFNDRLLRKYKTIFDFIINKNLFTTIPDSNDIEINNDLSTKIWLVDGYPMVNYIENKIQT